MTTSAKTHSNGRHKKMAGKQNGSHHVFDDILALAGTFARSQKEQYCKLHSFMGQRTLNSVQIESPDGRQEASRILRICLAYGHSAYVGR
jgi:hypothetical protein